VKLSDYANAKPSGLTMTMMDHALRLASEGWNVFPLRPNDKIPLFPSAHKKGDPPCKGECGRDGHGAYDGTTSVNTIRRWWTTNPNAGIGANLGEYRIAFDIDLNHNGRFLHSFPDTRRHLSGRGNGNAHLIYRYEAGSLASMIKSTVGAMGFIEGVDVRSKAGSYIVMPPSRHADTGKPYTRDEVKEHILTDAEVMAIFEEAGVQLPTVAKAASRGLTLVGGGVPAANNTLSALLNDPPSEGGRNEWLATVCGHYARQNRKMQDLYETHTRQANQLLTPPLDEEEYLKTASSIWEKEQAGHVEREADEDNGWLVGNKRTLMCRTMGKSGDDTVIDMGQWGDFDIEALGVAVNESGHRMYWIRIYWRKEVIDTTLDSSVLGDDRKLKGWFARFGATWNEPYAANPRMPASVRLQRYIESQEPAKVKIVSTLGWHEELQMFITHEGAITKDGPVTKEKAGVVADPAMIEKGIAPFTYGFAKDWAEAARVLDEVLSFQDEDSTSVFGAWWAACLLRPQMQAYTSLFPFFGVEATSESGKTNGFFDMMVGLNGNTMGQIVPTKPVMRDYSSANRNGMVWADDLDSLDAYGELLRSSTSNGTSSKMGMDRTAITNTQIVAPILITGESLGMNSQKALMDRSIVINVGSPKGRMSRHNPDMAQWDDIVTLQRMYPKDQGGLSQFAGWYVQFALAAERDVITALQRAKKKDSGRQGDKLAVLRAGAHLLDALCGHEGAWDGEGPHVARVEAWASAGAGAESLDKDNALTLKVLPWALRAFTESDPIRYDMGKFQNIDSPVFVKASGPGAYTFTDGLDDPEDMHQEVFVCIPMLAMAWARDKNNMVDQRTETLDALVQQGKALGVHGSKPVMVRGTGQRRRYTRLPDEYAKMVLKRANEG
jgi:hypothetical protein